MPGSSDEAPAPKSEDGAFEIEVPRDRDGSFDPRLIAKCQTRIDGLDEKIIALWVGLTPPPSHIRAAARSGSGASRRRETGISDGCYTSERWHRSARGGAGALATTCSGAC
jgi:hypothetical protein